MSLASRDIRTARLHLGKQKRELLGPLIPLLPLAGQSRGCKLKGLKPQPEERDRGVSACASGCTLEGQCYGTSPDSRGRCCLAWVSYCQVAM